MQAKQGCDHARALIIGISDYSSFDATGGRNLPGAIADAIAYWRLVRALGVPPSNIILCTSPRLTVADLGPDAAEASLRDADRETLLAAMQAFGQQLEGAQGAKGIAAYIGHGDQDAHGASVLCPSDIAQGPAGELQNTLPTDDVIARLRGRGQSAELTVFLDTCFAGAEAAPVGTAVRSLRPGRTTTAVRFDARKLGTVVFTASEGAQPSYEVEVDGGVRGAFSWAVTNLLNRWGVEETEAHGRAFGLSNQGLRDRAQTLIETLRVPQTVRLHASRRQRQRRVGHDFANRVTGDGEPKAAVARQVFPGIGSKVSGYNIKKISDGSSLGTLYVAGAGLGSPLTANGWKSGTHVWAWNSSAWPALDFKIVGYYDVTGTAPTVDHSLVWRFNTNLSWQSNGASVTPEYIVKIDTTEVGRLVTHVASGDAPNYKLSFYGASGSGTLGGNSDTLLFYSGGSATSPSYKVEDLDV
ncbi:MAG: caspase family protein [Myxococcales bacterium]|nr:caspase family protein [Myxococcales bacterium]